MIALINIISGVGIGGTPPAASNEYTKILYLTALPAEIELNTLVIVKGTLWRGLKAGELPFVNAKTPIPVKGYLEFTALKLTPEYYLTPYMNDFGHTFQITNTSAGVYVLAKTGNLAIVPLAGDPELSLNITFYDTAGMVYSYSWAIITVGADTGKIHINITKHEASANTASNAKFFLNLKANYFF